MSNQWSNVISNEREDEVRLLNLSLKCFLILAQKLNYRFREYTFLWGTITEATPSIIDLALKYLVEFKKLYLSEELKRGDANLPFYSPSAVSIIFRYQ